MRRHEGPFPEAFPGHVHATARWVVGADPFSPRQYLLHNQFPRFLAKVGAADDDSRLSAVSFGLADDRSLYDFIWLDPCPGEADLFALMREAETVLERARTA